MWKYPPSKNLSENNEWLANSQVGEMSKEIACQIIYALTKCTETGKRGWIMFQSEQDFRIHCDLWTHSILESCYIRSNMNFVLAV